MKKSYSLLLSGLLLTTSLLTTPSAALAAPAPPTVQIAAAGLTMSSISTENPAKVNDTQTQQAASQRIATTKKKSKAGKIFLFVGIGIALAVMRAVIASS